MSDLVYWRMSLTDAKQTKTMFYLAAFRLSVSELSVFCFFFHLKSLSVPLLSSLSTDSSRFASLLENKFLKDFLPEKLFFAMPTNTQKIPRGAVNRVYRWLQSSTLQLCSLVHCDHQWHTRRMTQMWADLSVMIINSHNSHTHREIWICWSVLLNCSFTLT